MTRVALVLLLVMTSGCHRDDATTRLSPAPGALRVLDVGGPRGDTGAWPSLTLDANQEPHLAYCDVAHGDLHYAARRAGVWSVREVAVEQGAVGKYASLTLGGDGRPSIAYYDQDTSTLRYASRSSEGWSNELIGWGLEIGVSARLLLGDGPRVYYYASDGTYRIAERKSDGWTQNVLARATFGPKTRADVVERSGRVSVALVDWDFRDVSVLLLHPWAAKGAAPLVVARGADVGFGAALAFDEQGAPRVFYTRAGTLYVTRPGPSGFSSEQVYDHVGSFAVAGSAPREGGSDLAIAVQDVRGGSGSIVLLRERDARFFPSLVDDEGPLGDHLALVVDTYGRATLAYHASSIRGLKVYEELDAPP